jgi:hypothetical protein
MRTARHRTAWPVAVLVVLALGVTGCRKADESRGRARLAHRPPASLGPISMVALPPPRQR